MDANEKLGLGKSSTGSVPPPQRGCVPEERMKDKAQCKKQARSLTSCSPVDKTKTKQVAPSKHKLARE